MIEIWGKIEWKVIQWEIKTQWKIKNQIRSETAFDKLKEKISKLECRSHETFQKTWKKDKVSDYIKSRLKHRLPRWLSGKKFSCQCRRQRALGSIAGSERYPGGGNGNPRQYSCLENPWSVEPVHRIAKSQTQLGSCVYTHSHTHLNTHGI